MAAVGGAFQAFSYFRGSSNSAANYILETVQRGPFRVVVAERGVLRSFANSTLANTVEGSTTIIKLVPEGTEVKKPTLSPITGTIREIVESGNSRTVKIKGDPLLIATSPIFIHVDGVTREVFAPFEKYTQMLVKVDDHVEIGHRISGDVVCELEASALEDKEKQQKISVTQAEASLQKSRKDVEIQRTQNRSDISKAKLDLDLAELDLKKFQEGERVQLENEALSQVLIAQEELTRAQENYEFFDRQSKKNLKTLTELDSVRITRDKAKIKYDLETEKLAVLRKFTFVRNIKEYTENVAEARRELRRVELSGMAALDQFKAALKAAELTYSVEKANHEFLIRQIQACMLVAPQDGKVVYANQKSHREEVIIEEGITVRQRQRIINLPDFDQMGVETKIHESKISNINVGMPVNIRVSAFPEKLYNGEVVEVPEVPVKGDWPHTDQMLYETKIKLYGKHEELKPNMNTELEIIADERDDVLQVPVQALFAIGSEYAAYIVNGDDLPRLARGIKIGLSNNKNVEILEGLSEGDQVVMSPRTQFGTEIDELLAAFASKQSKEISDSVKERKKRESSNGKKSSRNRNGRNKRGANSKKTRRSKARASGGDPMAFFKKMDKNSDGKIAGDEISERMRGMVSRFDKNGDNAIDANEWREGTKRGGGRQ